MINSIISFILTIFLGFILIVVIFAIWERGRK